MIAYDGWDREYEENRSAYLDIFESFMKQTNYENNEKFEGSISRIGEFVNSNTFVTSALAKENETKIKIIKLKNLYIKNL